MKYSLFSALSLLLLTACIDPVQQQMLAQQREEADNQECQRLGFRPGNEAYGNCRLKLLEIRAINRQASRVYYEPIPPYNYRYNRY